MFANRQQAGQRLGNALSIFRDQSCIVFALLRGGVPVAVEVAKALDAPLYVLPVRKIGLPRDPEVAMGAIVDGREPVIVRNKHVIASSGISPERFSEQSLRVMAALRRLRDIYKLYTYEGSLKGKVVVVVDDGLATGATSKAAIESLRMRSAARTILAVPVGSPEIVKELELVADRVLCLETPCDFDAVGRSYRDFIPVSDKEVLEILRTHAVAVKQ